MIVTEATNWAEPLAAPSECCDGPISPHQHISVSTSQPGWSLGNCSVNLYTETTVESESESHTESLIPNTSPVQSGEKYEIILHLSLRGAVLWGETNTI